MVRAETDPDDPYEILDRHLLRLCWIASWIGSKAEA
jgi:hypothetical protein